MGVIDVNEGLEISDFNHFSRILLVLDQRIQLNGTFSMLGQKLLNLGIVKELVLSKSKDFECLLLCHKTTFDSEALFGYLLSAAVTKLFHKNLVILFLEII